MPVQASDFPAFAREMTGYDPFPWQRRLVDEVLAHGWPDLLDLPTGTGKTTTLLVALFVLAIDPARFQRRIALVVDRRIIVDQVEAYARSLAEGLKSAERPTVRRVAERLVALSLRPDAEPVRVVHLRGGIPRDDAWIGHPDQPTLIASTVDQVGSRLLFRGYGVSEGMRPIHAGVLARDTLYLLDEVHLATAFEETLGSLADTFASARWVERGGTGRPFRVVRMSATPRDHDERRTFPLDDADRSHPILGPRLTISRLATLEEVKTSRARKGDDPTGDSGNHTAVAKHALERVQDAVGQGARRIGVVVNRVDTARRIARQLLARPELRVLLVTGRMRGYERTQQQPELRRAAGAGVSLEPDAPPTVVVATSCIEAGADLDFEALITEAASLDALRQRFGRFNRLGNHPRTCAWILGRKDQIGDSADNDPVYGPALRRTWAYLQRVATDGRVDFGLQAFPAPTREELPSLLPPMAEAPVMFPRYLDAWSETRPAPHPDPDPALWLHGKKRPANDDVLVVFRAGLPDPTSRLGEPGEPSPAEIVEAMFEALPPLADEAVAVRRGEVQRWRKGLLTWRWGATGIEAIEHDDIAVGDTVVVDAKVGGLSLGTWDPEALGPVDDVAERVLWTTRQTARLRLHRDTLPAAFEAPPSEPVDDNVEDREAYDEAIAAYLVKYADDPATPRDWQPLFAHLATRACDVTVVPPLPRTPAALRVPLVVLDRNVTDPSTDDATSSFIGQEVTLDQHLRDVEGWAEALAKAAGLDPDLAHDVAFAGLLHDLGKADLRFQALLRGGDAIAAAGSPWLAKSRQGLSFAGRQRAELRSGWPAGLRHELLSLALLESSDTLRAQARDLDLVRHLVASHHGWCRPWAPSMPDPQPSIVQVSIAGVDLEVSTASIDADLIHACPSRFRRLCRRYGWHGLAYLEALLRLGDHQASRTPGEPPQESTR